MDQGWAGLMCDTHSWLISRTPCSTTACACPQSAVETELNALLPLVEQLGNYHTCADSPASTGVAAALLKRSRERGFTTVTTGVSASFGAVFGPAVN